MICDNNPLFSKGLVETFESKQPGILWLSLAGQAAKTVTGAWRTAETLRKGRKVDLILTSILQIPFYSGFVGFKKIRNGGRDDNQGKEALFKILTTWPADKVNEEIQVSLLSREYRWFLIKSGSLPAMG